MSDYLKNLQENVLLNESFLRTKEEKKIEPNEDKVHNTESEKTEE